MLECSQNAHLAANIHVARYVIDEDRLFHDFDCEESVEVDVAGASHFSKVASAQCVEELVRTNAFSSYAIDRGLGTRKK